MTRKQRRRSVVAVRVPMEQAAFVHVPGPRGGWFVSLLWAFGDDIAVSWQDFRKMLTTRDGSVLVGRRLNPTETRLLEQSRADGDQDAHARIVWNDAVRWSPKKKRR